MAKPGSVASKVGPFIRPTPSGIPVAGQYANTPIDPVATFLGDMPKVGDPARVPPTANPRLDASDFKAAK